jgi:phosphatidylethanolamine/phosphatidyl-N-methylethanolamine N-methyltransferase
MGIMSFVKEIWKHPRELSTIFPSSRFLARTIADQIDFDEPATIVELGPGDGALTYPLIDRLHPESELLLVEVNDRFCDELEETFGDHENWGRVEVINRSADELDEILAERGIDHVDYVVSGLPLSTLPDELSMNVLHTVNGVLDEDGGRYIQFQLSQDYKETVEDVFGDLESLHRVLLNMPPAWVYVASKNAE